MGKRERVHIRERLCKDGSRTLQLDYSYKGKRYRISTGLFLTGNEVQDRNTSALATELRNKKENELLQLERGLLQPNYRGNLISVRDYALKIAETKEKKSSKQNYLDLAKRLPKDLMLSSVTRTNFPDILATTTPPKCSINTKHLYGTILRAVLNRAYNDGILEVLPNLKGLIPSSQKGNKEFLTEAELVRLQEVKDNSFEGTKRLFLFSVNTGLRISDIESLRWEDIIDNRIVKRQVKTERAIRIPINDTAKALMPPQQETGLVFAKIPRNTIGRQLKELCHAADIKKHITFHCARVTCATQLLSRGTDIYTVSRILGHTDIKTTMVYLRLLDDTLVKAIDSLDQIGSSVSEKSPGDNILHLDALLKLNTITESTPLAAKDQP